MCNYKIADWIFSGTGVLTGTGLLVTDSSGQFVLQIQSTGLYFPSPLPFVQAN